MTCGCYPPYPFPNASCMSSTWQNSGSPGTCRNHLPAVRSNFVTPAADSPVTIETTDTASLWVGQGIMIGNAFYIITDILDALKIEARHNGLGASPGTTIIAVHPTYGCYQFPIIPVGKVSLDTTPSLAALNLTADAAIASSISAASINKMVYGYLGPTTIQFQFEAQFTLANTPPWIGVSLPIYRRVDPPHGSFAAWLEDGGYSGKAVAKFGNGDYTHYLIVGYGGGNLFSDGTLRRVAASGNYEILL